MVVMFITFHRIESGQTRAESVCHVANLTYVYVIYFPIKSTMYQSSYLATGNTKIVVCHVHDGAFV